MEEQYVIFHIYMMYSIVTINYAVIPNTYIIVYDVCYTVRKKGKK